MYPNATSSSGIGNLLRLIQEEKAQQMANIPPSAQQAAPVREAVTGPVVGAEDPGTSRVVGIKPEAVIGPSTPATVTGAIPMRSTVGPTAIGGQMGGGPGSVVGPVTPPPASPSGVVGPLPAPSSAPSPGPAPSQPSQGAVLGTQIKAALNTPNRGTGADISGLLADSQALNDRAQASNDASAASREENNRRYEMLMKGQNPDKASPAPGTLGALPTNCRPPETPKLATTPWYMKSPLSWLFGW
jgi:hypothetical protein